MIRLLGFLVGAAASIGMILLILGVPDINLSKQLIDAENIESVSQIVEDVTTDLEAIASDVIDEITDKASEEATEEASEEVTGEIPELVDALPPAELNVAEFPAETPEPTADTLTPEDPQIAALPAVQSNGTADETLIENDLKWHAFWNPFRSRIAADGFVGQLEKVTGLDYRVVKIKTGVYEVTFGYEDDAERRNKMSLIASATGLDLPDS